MSQTEEFFFQLCSSPWYLTSLMALRRTLSISLKTEKKIKKIKTHFIWPTTISISFLSFLLKKKKNWRFSSRYFSQQRKILTSWNLDFSLDKALLLKIWNSLHLPFVPPHHAANDATHIYFCRLSRRRPLVKTVMGNKQSFLFSPLLLSSSQLSKTFCTSTKSYSASSWLFWPYRTIALCHPLTSKEKHTE